MFAEIRNWRWWVAATAIVLLSTVVWAGDNDKKAAKPGQYDPDAKTVELFAAINKGDIAVKLITKDSKQSKVLIENKTDQPLNIKLPDAFAGVPVLAQNLGGAGGRAGGSSGNRGNQRVGGGMGGGGMGGGMGGMGGGMFNVPAEQVGKFDVATVCLDHGKADPRPAVHYEIKPLESTTTKEGVRELCELVGKRQVNQRAAQAAAWHLNNDMSWEQLAAKRLKYANGTSKPYFMPEELQAAQQIASTAVGLAEQRKKSEATQTNKPEGMSPEQKSPGDK